MSKKKFAAGLLGLFLVVSVALPSFAAAAKKTGPGLNVENNYAAARTTQATDVGETCLTTGYGDCKKCPSGIGYCGTHCEILCVGTSGKPVKRSARCDYHRGCNYVLHE